MVGANVLSPNDAASREPVVVSAQRVVSKPLVREVGFWPKNSIRLRNSVGFPDDTTLVLINSRTGSTKQCLRLTDSNGYHVQQTGHQPVWLPIQLVVN